MISTFSIGQKELELLPASLQKIIQNSSTLEILKKISADFSFTLEQEKNFVEILTSIIKGEEELYDCAALISGVLEMDFEKALEINDRLYQELFFKVEEDVNNQYRIFQKRKLPATEKKPVVEEMDLEKARKEKSDSAQLIEKALAKFSLQFKDEKLKTRFIEISESFLNNARTKAQFKNTLMKSAETGGLGMEKEQAENIANFLASYLRIGGLEKKQEQKRQENQTPSSSPLVRGRASRAGGAESLVVPSSPLPSPSVSSVIPAIRPGAHGRTTQAGIQVRTDRPDFEAEEREAEKLKKKVAEFKEAAPHVSEEKIAKALKEINLDFPSAELNSRLKSLVDSRLRNVRTSVQTFERLTLDIKNGGLDLPKTDADKISLILNKYLDASNKDLYSGKISEIKEQQGKAIQDFEEKKKHEESNQQKNLEERFAKLITKSPKAQKQEKKRQERGNKRQATGDRKQETGNKGQGEEDQKEKSPLSSLSAPSVIPAEAGIQPNSQKSPLKSAVILKPKNKSLMYKIFPVLEKPAKGKETRAYAPEPPISEIENVPKKQKLSIPQEDRPFFDIPTKKTPMDDIAYKPKLYGPVEEIENMTLEDFRRLSGDPKEAILKIKDKLSLLRDESFKKYQMGIEAWQKSPVYKDYVNILKKSLAEAKPIPDTIKSSQTLTQEEFNGIMEGEIGD